VLSLMIVACATLLLWALDNDRRVQEAQARAARPHVRRPR
jgi:hypothetical protein